MVKIGSGNSFLPVQHWAINWTKAHFLSSGPLRTKNQWHLNHTEIFPLKKCIWKYHLQNIKHIVQHCHHWRHCRLSLCSDNNVGIMMTCCNTRSVISYDEVIIMTTCYKWYAGMPPVTIKLASWRLVMTPCSPSDDEVGISGLPVFHDEMERFSMLLALCAENSPFTSEFPTQRPVTWSFDVFFDLHMNKWLLPIYIIYRWVPRLSQVNRN